MSDRVCSIEGCERPKSSRGWCNTHYERWRLRGSTDDPVRAPEICTIEGCDKDHVARGWCGTHYARWRKHGDPHTVKQVQYPSPEEAFEARTIPVTETACLIWTGSLSWGYGRIRVDGDEVPAHRYAWERVNGPVPEGKDLNHRCWNKACVNVDHLEVASRSENNAYQQGARSDNTSGHRNVSKHKQSGRWAVRIGKNRKYFSFGLYNSIEEAAQVAEQKRRELFGEFAGKG